LQGSAAEYRASPAAMKKAAGNARRLFELPIFSQPKTQVAFSEKPVVRSKNSRTAKTRNHNLHERLPSAIK
jgi:hypothetical protein